MNTYNAYEAINSSRPSTPAIRTDEDEKYNSTNLSTSPETPVKFQQIDEATANFHNYLPQTYKTSDIPFSTNGSTEINDNNNSNSAFESPMSIIHSSKYSHSPYVASPSFSNPIDFSSTNNKNETHEPHLNVISHWNQINEQLKTVQDQLTVDPLDEEALSASMDYYLADSSPSPHPHLLLKKSENDRKKKEHNNDLDDTKFDFSDIVVSNGTVGASEVIAFNTALPTPNSNVNMVNIMMPQTMICNNINMNMNMNMNMKVNMNLSTNKSNVIENHQTMGIRKLVKLALKKGLSMKQLVEGDLIRRFMFDQDGARYVQSLLHTKKSKDVSLLIRHLVFLHTNNKLNLTTLACHKYGNYTLSLIFELGENSELNLMLDTFLYQSVVTLSESFSGSRVLMKILDILLTNAKDLLLKLLKKFKQTVVKTCQNYDFCVYLDGMNESSAMVIQKMLDLNLPCNSIKFIGDALDSKLAHFCGTIYGSRIVQKYISSYGTELNVMQLFDDRDSYFTLSKSVYGNYTIQKILKRNQSYSNLLMYRKFRNTFISNIFIDGEKLVDLSINKHGSALIETCIKVSTRPQITKFVETSCKNKAEVLLKILYGEYGNFVAKTLLRACTEYKAERKRIVNAVNQYAINLNDYGRYGRSQLKAMNLQKCAVFIKECYEWYTYY